MPEQWSEIEGFPDYLISDHGTVYNRRYDRILIPYRTPYGRLRVSLRRGNQTQYRYVHRLVAIAFRRDLRNTEITHRDADGTNNHADNLIHRFERNSLDE